VTLLPDATPAGVASPAPVPGPEEKRPPPPAKPGKVDRRPPVKPPVKDKAAAAERQAAALYKDRQFDKAAEVLQAAAASESGATADRLETTARDYVALGAALAKGDAAVAANPTGALVAYQQALTLDARSGRAAHAAYLKGQLAKVAPRAAQAFMSAGKLEQARATCDAADGYGVGTDPAIARTRAQLETKAKDLYGQAQAVAKKSPEQAKALWRRVLKIVPTDSTWYQKSYAALNAGQKGQDEDE
jgi:tetratricopeptide (TPR) repeat protein